MRSLTTLITLFGTAAVLLASESDQHLSIKEPDNGREELDQLFKRFGGFDGDPNVNRFRELGSNAVAYLADKVTRHDLLFKRAEILIYTNLPSGMASKVRPPVSLTPDQIKALQVLRQMGPAYTRLPPALEALTVALGDWTEGVRIIAQGALGDAGSAASNAVPALIDAVERSQARINGIWALGRIGAQAKAAIPALQRVLASSTGREMVYAAEALHRVDPGNPRPLDYLQTGLKDTNRQARAEAAEALRQFGAGAQASLPALRAALRDSDSWVQFNAARALVEIGPRDEEAVALLQQVLTNPSPTEDFRGLLAAQSLLKCPPAPVKAASFVEGKLQQKDERVRLYAALLMSEAGLESPAVLPVLTDVLTTSADYRNLVLATKAVGQIGPRASGVLPVLRRLLTSKDQELRATAAEALSRVQLGSTAE